MSASSAASHHAAGVPPLRDVWAVVVAGGSGTRFGERKQVARLAGRPVLAWAVEVLAAQVDGVVVVVPRDLVPVIPGLDPALGSVVVVAGGDTRSASVRAGLAAIGPQASHVLVHDAARPLTPSAVVEAVIDGLRAGHDAVIPVVPIADTLRRRDGGSVDRDQFVAVQTPQGFLVSALVAAHGADGEATDDAGLIDRAGGSVHHVAGDPRNLKLTVPHDLVVAEALMSSESRR